MRLHHRAWLKWIHDGDDPREKHRVVLLSSVKARWKAFSLPQSQVFRFKAYFILHAGNLLSETSLGDIDL